MRYVVFLLCGSLWACKSAAQLYEGTIGKSPVFLELSSSDGEVYGNYFYKRTGINIPFEGTTKGASMAFYAGSHFKDSTEQEHFTLSKKGTTLSGRWMYAGKSLPVKLALVNPAKIDNRFVKSNHFTSTLELKPMELARTSLAYFQPLDSMTVQNGIVFQWYKETHWESYLFRVVKGLPEATMNWLNAFLENQQLLAFSDYGSCGFGESEPEFHANVGSFFVNADFFSMELQFDYYCGGAHPDFATVPYNLDLRAPEVLNTEDLLQFNGFVERTDANFDNWLNYRSDVYSVFVNDYLKAHYPENYGPQDENEELCNYDDPELWTFSEALITPDGLLFGAYFPRYMRMCDDPGWSVIPYSELTEFLNPAYRERLLKIGK